MNKTKAIGVDLGTTFSCAAIFDKDLSKMIPNLEGHNLTPSLIFYDPSTLKVSVGTTAVDKAPTRRDNFFYDMKRIIGRRYDDVYVQNIIESENYQFRIVRGKEDKAEIKIHYDHSDVIVQKSPEEACSEILKYLKKSAEESLGHEVKHAVISVPAYFSNAQRTATKTAADLAGLKVLKLVTEPVAAAIHYSFDKLNTESTMLMFDWGGGTLDVSIIQVCGKRFVVKSVEGDTFLGGRDFDEIILTHFKAELVQKIGQTCINSKLIFRLRDFCKRIKVKLSTEMQYSLLIDYIEGFEGIQYTLLLTREKFEELTEKLFKKALNVVEMALKNVELTKHNIDDIVLVGGSSRMPKIRKLLSDYFNGKQLKTDVNPDEAVALGAALQAFVLTNDNENFEKFKITEVTPLSLGYRLYGDLMRFVIKKNTPLPTTSRNINCETSYNNQTGCTFTICEGERKNCKFNNELGKLIINNLPPRKIGEVKFQIKFHLDEDGILTVTARESATGTLAQLVVTLGEFRLCEKEIKRVLIDATKNKLEDEKFEQFVYYLCDKRRKISQIIYDIKKLPDKHQVIVRNLCENFLKISETVKYSQFEELQIEYYALTTEIKPKIKEFIDVNLDLNLDAILDSLEKGNILDNMLLNNDFLQLIEKELEKITIDKENDSNEVPNPKAKPRKHDIKHK